MLFTYEDTFVASIPEHHKGIAPIKRVYHGDGDPRDALKKDERYNIVFVDHVFRTEGCPGGLDYYVHLRIAEGGTHTIFTSRLVDQEDYLHFGKRVWFYRFADTHYFDEAGDDSILPFMREYAIRQIRKKAFCLWRNCLEGPVGISRSKSEWCLRAHYPKNRLAERIEYNMLVNCSFFGHVDVDKLYEEANSYSDRQHSPKEEIITNICDDLIDAYAVPLFP